MGAYGTILFFQFDKQWKKVATGVIGFFGSSGVGWIANSYFAVSNEVKAFCFLMMYVSIGASVCLLFKKIIKIIQNDESRMPLRKMDFILGYNKALQQYYENRQKEADSIDIKKRREVLERKEVSIREREERLKNQMTDKLKITLPENVEYPITKRFIDLLPVFIDHLYAFRCNINKLTEQFCEELPGSNKEENKESLKAYFMGIGMYVANDLFGISGNNKDVRTHFRIYSKDQYVQCVVVEGAKLSKKRIRDIPTKENSLINKAFELRRSVIASMNSESVLDLHTSWEDFMTIPYYKLVYDGHLFLSMGISVKNREQFKETLAFLNFYKIEECLQIYIDRINSKCDIIENLG